MRTISKVPASILSFTNDESCYLSMRENFSNGATHPSDAICKIWKQARQPDQFSRDAVESLTQVHALTSKSGTNRLHVYLKQ